MAAAISYEVLVEFYRERFRRRIVEREFERDLEHVLRVKTPSMRCRLLVQGDHLQAARRCDRRALFGPGRRILPQKQFDRRESCG
jgi:hypothetical protein